MTRLAAFILVLALASLACTIQATETPAPTQAVPAIMPMRVILAEPTETAAPTLTPWAAATATPAPAWVCVVATGRTDQPGALNVRAVPGGAIVATLSDGERVEILAQSGEWLQIDGGWIFGGLCK